MIYRYFGLEKNSAQTIYQANKRKKINNKMCKNSTYEFEIIIIGDDKNYERKTQTIMECNSAIMLFCNINRFISNFAISCDWISNRFSNCNCNIYSCFFNWTLL